MMNCDSLLGDLVSLVWLDEDELQWESAHVLSVDLGGLVADELIEAAPVARHARREIATDSVMHGDSLAVVVLPCRRELAAG